MKHVNYFASLVLLTDMLFSCSQQDETIIMDDEISPETLASLTNAGFNVLDQAPIKFDDGYLVEGDIYIAKHQLASLKKGRILPASSIAMTISCLPVVIG